jgi:hypothetical protein
MESPKRPCGYKATGYTPYLTKVPTFDVLLIR